MTQEEQKQAAAEAALEFIELGDVVGVGTGSTTNYFIDALAQVKGKLEGAVASSEASAAKLYVDGADEATRNLHLIKGGGGALTREKIVASASRKFVCIVDESKLSDVLGSFPLPVEVIPMAQSLVSRKLIGMGGLPELRPDLITDNGNVILDVRNLDLTDPMTVETALNAIAGVVDNGNFAQQRANVLLVGRGSGVDQITV